MGYRLTFYNCPKSVIEKYKNLTDKDFEYDDSDEMYSYALFYIGEAL